MLKSTKKHMAKTTPRKRKKPDTEPRAEDHPAEPPKAPGIAEWAKGLIDELAGHIPGEEITLLRTQTEALNREEAAPQALPPDPSKPVIVKSEAALLTLAAKVAESGDVVIDLETSSLDHRTGEIVGVGLAVADTTYYIPVGHRFREGRRLRPGQLPLLEVLQAVALHDKPLIAHNAKFEMKWLRHHGSFEPQLAWDTMLAARLLRSDLPADLKTVAARELDVPDRGLTSAEMREIQYMPIETVAAYCAKDCSFTLELFRRQKSCLA